MAGQQLPRNFVEIKSKPHAQMSRKPTEVEEEAEHKSITTVGKIQRSAQQAAEGEEMEPKESQHEHLYQYKEENGQLRPSQFIEQPERHKENSGKSMEEDMKDRSSDVQEVRGLQEGKHICDVCGGKLEKTLKLINNLALCGQCIVRLFP